MLTLRQLRYFVAVIDAGSMTRAAEALHVAPTALSLQMKALEEHLGVALIHRHSRGIAATDQGAELYKRASEILRLVDEAKRRIAPQAFARTVTLGVPPGLARIVGVAAFLGISERLPGLAIEVTEGWTIDLARKLEQGELDVVVGYALAGSEEVEVRPLLEDRLVFVSPPGSGGVATPISLAEALTHNLVFYGQKSVGWQAVVKAAEREGIPFRADRHVDSISVWRELMRQGHGHSIAPFGVIGEEFARRELEVRPLTTPLTVPVSLGIRRKLLDEPWSAGLVDFIAGLVLSAEARFTAGADADRPQA